jgi:2-keto-3-deoxy-L-rhamnonate aldolase RhmA
MQNDISIGSWITLNHMGIVEIMADAGFNWLCIDMEHSVIDYDGAQNLIATIQAKGLQAFVRVGENNTRIIKRVLDAGADGVIVPMVCSEADAIRAIDAVKYPPLGIRGVGLARAQKYGFGFEEYRDTIANNVKLIVQIEHVDGVNNLEEILSLEGVDGSIVGPYDLSGSMGKPGQYYDEDVKEVLEKYERTVKKYNKTIGFHVIEPDHNLVLEKINKGYNFIAFSLDSIFLGQMARTQMNNLKQEIEK